MSEKKIYKLIAIERATGTRGVCAFSDIDESTLLGYSKQTIDHPVDGEMKLAVVAEDHLYALYAVMEALLPRFSETHDYAFGSGYATEEETSVHF